MPSFSHGFLLGHIGNNPRISTTKNGKNVANFDIAVQAYDKTLGDKSPSVWYSVSAWSIAATQASNFKKGDCVLVQTDSPISYREYDKKDGSKGIELKVTTFFCVKCLWFKGEAGAGAPPSEPGFDGEAF